MIHKTLIVALLCLLPGLTSAAGLEVVRLAELLEQASLNLASSARGMAGLGSVEHNAERLGEQAQRLKDSVGRGRTSAYVRLRFTDVSRYYQRLESAVLRTRDGGSLHRLRYSFDQLASVYENLRYEFYGDSGYQSVRSGPQPFIPGRPGPADRYVRNDDLGLTAAPPQRAGSHRAPVTERLQRDEYPYSHRSPVQERQRRNERIRQGDSAPDGARRENPLSANQGYYRLGQPQVLH